MSLLRSRPSLAPAPLRHAAGAPKARRPRRGRPPCLFELLEDRRLLTVGNSLIVGGLEFRATEDFTPNGTDYSASGVVSVGFAPGSGTFQEILRLDGSVTVKDDADPSFVVNGTVAEALTSTPITLFNGTQSFDIDSLINAGLSGLDGLSFDVAGVDFELDTIKLVSGPALQLQGSLSVAGLDVQVNGTNSVDISTSGVSLTGVDATLNGSTQIGSVTFDADALTVAYAHTNGNDIFTITGGSGFTVGGTTVQVNWGGTTPKGTPTAGLVFQNGALQSLDMAVTGSVTVGALAFTADDLTMTYAAATSTFTMTGGADFQLDSNKVDVQFGGTAGSNQTAGLVIVNGALTRLDMTVNASFSLFGLDLDADALVFQYQSNSSQFLMYGTLALSSAVQPFSGTTGQVFDGIAATLGSQANPGLVVQSGVLQDVNITLNGQFNLFGLTVTPTDLNVTYSNAASTVQITGDLTVTLADGVVTATQFDDGGVLIDTATGAVTIDGVTLSLQQVDLGVVTIENFKLAYTQTSTTTTFDATLELLFDGGWALDAQVDFTNGQIQQITVGYEAGTSQGIAMGETGLFLTSFSTTIANISSGVTTVSGSIAVDYGPHVTINGQSVAIISASGNFLVDSDEFTLTDLDVSIADGIIGSGSGSIVADWAAGDYSLDAQLSLLDGTFTVDGKLQFDNEGDFLLSASADVNVPDAVPVIGGDNLASLNFAFKYISNGGNPTGFIAAWDTISFLDWTQDIGFSYAIDGSISSGDFSLIGDDGVQAVENQLNLPTSAPSPFNPIVGYFGGEAAQILAVAPGVLQVPVGVSTVSLMLQNVGKQGAFPGDVYLLLPPTTEQTLSKVLALNTTLNPQSSSQLFPFRNSNVNGTFIIRQDSPSTIAVLIQAPVGQMLPPGQYALMYSPYEWGPIMPQNNNALTYIQPVPDTPAVQTTGLGTATVTATGLVAAPLAPTTVVSFYATTGTTPGQGTLIGEVSQAQGGLNVASDGSFTATFNWNGLDLPVGSYSVYAVVNDGQNPPVLSAVSTSSLTIAPMATGVVSAGGQPVSSVTVQIYYNATLDHMSTNPDYTTTTGADGRYNFTNYGGGTAQDPLSIVVKVLVPVGYTADGPTMIQSAFSGGAPATVSFDLDPSAGITGVVTNPRASRPDSTAPIAGATVFLDLNRNGVLDPGEPSTRSDSQGRYTFVNLDPGPYQVVTLPPPGYGPTTPTARDVTVAHEQHRVSGVDFGFQHSITTPATSTPVYPAGGKTVGPLVTTAISGTASDPRGAGAITAVVVSVQDLNTGFYWNGRSFIASSSPIELTARGTTSWRLPLAASALTSGHTYQIGSRAMDAEGYDQAAPSYQTFTFRGPAAASTASAEATVSVTSAQPISVVGQPVAFTVQVSPRSGTGTPTGTVWIADGSVMLGMQPIVEGHATFLVDSLKAGSHSLQVYYSGDANFYATTSAKITQTVQQVALTPVTAETVSPPPVAGVGLQVLNIGGAAAGAGEQILVRPVNGGRFVQVRVVQAGTGTVVYDAVLPSRSLRGIVVYDGPGEESIRFVGRSPVPIWVSRSGSLTPASSTVASSTPFRNRRPRFRAAPTATPVAGFATASRGTRPQWGV